MNSYPENTLMLYHFSEEPDIARFVPRAPLALPTQEPLVWTIDHIHAPLYYFPRDCPRAAFWPLTTTTVEDKARFYSGTSAKMVIAIEYAWLARLQSTRLYRYEMPEETFVSLQDYGAHISRATVIPSRVEPLQDLLTQLAEANVELRLCTRLGPLVRAILASTLHYSCIRLRNALDWEEIQRF